MEKGFGSPRLDRWLTTSSVGALIRAALLGWAVFAGIAFSPLSASATTYTATDYASLVSAINSVNGGSGGDTINITASITLSGELPVITQGVIVAGNGNSVSGASTYRVFFVDAPAAAAVNIQNLTIANGNATGGAGGLGAGGGGGLGGGLFAISGAVTLTNVQFSSNAAQGGAGGASGSASGGGGLGGAGGTAEGGGGGVGLGATGAPNDHSAGGAGILPGGSGGNGGGGGGPGVGGANSGGGGGGYISGSGGGGGLNGSAGGGSAGGAGGFGGGGGGAEGDVAGGAGGAGGFGGGGGSGIYGSGVGGAGGFGGGGGSGYGSNAGGTGGSFGGAGSTNAGGGGGGAGLGGAIFVCSNSINTNCNATLSIVNTATNGISGSATGGTGGTGAGGGQGLGGALFLTTGAQANVSVGSGTTTTLSSDIGGMSGDGGVAVSGGGTLALGSSTNSFTGNLSVTGSGTTVSVGADSALGSGNTVALGAGTTLLFTAGGTYSHAVTVSGDPAFNVTSGQTVTYSGLIADGSSAGTVEVTGGGTLVLTDTSNSYSGGTTVVGGSTLSIASDSVLGNTSGGVTLGDSSTSGTLAATNTFSSARGFTLNAGGGIFDVAGGQTLTLSGMIGGGGGLTVTDTGTLTLSGANSYTGLTTVGTGAILALSGSGTIASSSGLTLNGTANFDISNTTSGATIAALNDDLAGTSTVSLGSSSQTLTIAGGGTYTGVIQDGGIGAGAGGNLTLTGGTLTLSGANSYTGLTTVGTGAILALSGSGTIASSSGLTLNGTANFDISNTTSGATIAALNDDLAGTSTVSLGSSSQTLTIAGGGTYTGVIQDGGIGAGAGGNLTLTGGTLTLSGANSYTGLTTVGTGAILALSGSGTIASSSGLTLNGTANFDISNTTSGATIAALNDDLAGTSTVSLGSSSQTLTIAGGGTYTGVIQDGGIGAGAGGNLTLTGGTLTLSGANSYTGLTTVGTGAILALSGSGTIASSSGLTLNGTANFDISNTTSGATIAALNDDLAGTSTVSLGSSSQTLTIAGGGTYTGVIQDGGIGAGAGGNLTLTGGTLTLSGANSYTGLTTVGTGAILALSGSGTIASSSGLTLNGTANFDISNTTSGATIAALNDDLAGTSTVSLGSSSQTLTIAGGGTYTGVIQDGGIGAGAGGNLTLTGGTLTLSGANSYTGLTTVGTGAILALSGSGTIASSSGLTLNGTANFDISNTTSGATIAALNDDLAGTSTVSLGSSSQTLTIAGGGTYTGVIQDGGIGAGAGGNLTLTGGTLTLSGANSYTGLTTVGTGAILALSGSGTIASSSGLTLNGTANFDISNTTSGATIAALNDDLAGTSTVSLGSSSQTLTIAGGGTYTGVIQDGGIGAGAGGNLTLTGGTLTLSGANSYTGLTTVGTGAILALSGSGTIASSSGLTLNGTANFDISNTTSGATIAALNDDLAGTSTVSLGSSSQTLTIAGGGTYTGVIQDGGIGAGAGGNLTLTGGTLTLSGANSYTGLTTVGTGAILALSGSGTIASSSGLTLNGTANFDISNTTSGATIAALNDDLAGTSTVSLGSSSQTLTIAGGGTYTGVIQDGGIGAGAGGNLTLTGGTLTLSGANSYTGLTTVGTGAILALSGSGTIASSSGLTLNGTANFDISNTTSGATIAALNDDLAGTSTVSLGSSSQTLTIAGGGTYTGVIQDGGIGAGAGGNLTLTGGTLTLSGANSYTGLTTVGTGAILALSGSGTIASSSGLTLNGTANFDISNTTSGATIAALNDDLAGTSTVSLGSSSQTLTIAGGGTYTGVIQDGGIGAGAGGNLTLTGGTLTLSGANSYTGLTTVGTGAILALSGSGTIASSSGLTLNGTANFDISNTTSGATIAALNDDLAGTSTVSLGSSSQTLTIAGGGTYTGVIQDGGIGAGAGGNLTLTGGTLTLSGANSYTGLTTVGTGAILALSGSGTIASSSGLTLNGTANFDISNTTSGATIAALNDDLAGTSTVSLGSSSQTLTIAGGGTYTGVIQDGGIGAGAGGNLTLTGGTLTLSGANSYTGLTTVGTGAILALSGSGTIASSSGLTLNGTANFDISNTTSGATIVTLFSCSCSTGTVALGGQTLTISGSALGTFSGTIQDGGIGGGIGGSVTVSEGGSLVLSGVNTYTGATTINGGGSGAEIDLKGSGSIADSSGLTMNGVAIFDISRVTSGTTIATLTDDGSFKGTIYLGSKTLTIANGGGNSFSGTLWNGGGGGGTGGNLTLAGGTLTLSGANYYTGTTTIDTGAILALSGSGSIADSRIADSGTFDISGTTSGATIPGLTGSGGVTLGGETLTINQSGSSTYAGAISGGGGLVLAGSGTLILDGINTLTGGTTINGGVLEVGDASTPTASLAGNVTVDLGGTLAGHGTVGGNVTNNFGIVQPGGTIGTLNVGGTYTQGAAGTLKIEVNPTTASKLAVSGAATLAGTLNLVYDPGTYSAKTYQIVTYASHIGTFGTVTPTGLPTGFTETVNVLPTETDLALAGGSVGTNTGVFGSASNTILDTGFADGELVFDHLDNNQTGQNTDNVETMLAAASPMGVAFSGNLGQLAQAGTQLGPTLAKYGGWVRGIGNFLSVHGQGSNPAYGANAGGFLAGIDREWSQNLIVGVAGGYSHSFISQTGGGGGDIDTPRVMIYGSYKPAARVSIDAVAGVAYDRITTTRPTALPATATESHNGYEESLAVQAGYAVPEADNWTLVPRVGFQYLRLDQTSYNESGASGFDLSSPAAHTNSLQPVVSISAFKPFVTDTGMRIVPEFKLAYSRELLSTTQTLNLTTPAGSLVPSTGVSPARNIVTAGPAATIHLDQSLDLYADYKLSLGIGKSIDHNVFAGARWQF